MIWVKLLGLLAALAVFGWVIFRLSRSLHYGDPVPVDGPLAKIKKVPDRERAEHQG